MQLSSHQSWVATRLLRVVGEMGFPEKNEHAQTKEASRMAVSTSAKYLLSHMRSLLGRRSRHPLDSEDGGISTGDKGLRSTVGFQFGVRLRVPPFGLLPTAIRRKSYPIRLMAKFGTSAEALRSAA
jgi:hypothetical protein